jgi:MYXO-CTERM domain-containing protein
VSPERHRPNKHYSSISIMLCPLPHRDLLNGRQCAPKCRRQCAPKCPPRSRPSASNFSTPPCAIHSPSASPSAPSPTASSSPVPRFVALWALLWAGLLLLRRRLAQVRTVCAVEGRVGPPCRRPVGFLASPLRPYCPTPWLVSGPVQSAASELLLPRPSDESLNDLECVHFDMEAITRPAHVTCCPVRVQEVWCQSTGSCCGRMHGRLSWRRSRVRPT